METRAELNARLMLIGMPKGTYAKLLGSTPQSVSRHGKTREIPAVAETLARAWEIMSAEQRTEWTKRNELLKAIER